MKFFFQIILILPLAFIYSCSFSQDKEESLIGKEWLLYSRQFVTDNSVVSDDFIRYFRKSDRIFAIKFNKGGIVYIEDNQSGEKGYAQWEWNSEQRNGLFIGVENVGAELGIIELTDSDLKVEKDSDRPNNRIVEHYKHKDNYYWKDSEMEGKMLQAIKRYSQTLEIISFNVLETGVKNKTASFCLNRARNQGEEEICMNLDFLFKSGKKWKTSLFLKKEDGKLCIEKNVDELFSSPSKAQLDQEIITAIKRGNIEQLQIELLNKNCKGIISTKLFSNL